MALNFYFDTHIAKAAAVQLREKAVDVVRCEEVGMAAASDEEHLIYATEHRRIMVSQDADFTALDEIWKMAGRDHAGIIYIAEPYRGEAQISYVVRGILFYDEAERAEAVVYETEIANHLLYL